MFRFEDKYCSQVSFESKLQWQCGKRRRPDTPEIEGNFGDENGSLG